MTKKKLMTPSAVSKVGPEGYVHGWIKVAPGTAQHDHQLNTLGGLAAGHSQEAANAIDRARNASDEGRYKDAQIHMANAAALLNIAGRKRLAQAAQDASDSFVGAQPPIRDSASSAPVVHAPRDTLSDVMGGASMPPDSFYQKSRVLDEYELARIQIDAEVARRLAAGG
jgi:hypothetical protein